MTEKCDEDHGSGSFVRQHYHDFLNREPDPSGLAFWTNEITSRGSNQSCIELKLKILTLTPQSSFALLC
jgi:hypothetical protein